jgi:hypothetical protein
MRRPHPTQPAGRRTPALILDALAASLGGSVIVTVITAVAVGVALVAAAFALYDSAIALTSPALAAALTAIALTLVAVLTGVIGPRIVRAKTRAADRRLGVAQPILSPVALRIGGEVALALIGFSAERALRHKAEVRTVRKAKRR